jgi:hypothetical protein
VLKTNRKNFITRFQKANKKANQSKAKQNQKQKQQHISLSDVTIMHASRLSIMHI